MHFTESFRRQHDAALAIAGEIAADLERLRAADDSALARATGMKLARLSGLLRIHFAQEDKLLYPRLMASSDAATAATARRFFDEMGGLGPVYTAFSERWTRPGAIAADPEAFCTECEGVFGALEKRIAHENEVLYPLADRPVPCAAAA